VKANACSAKPASIFSVTVRSASVLAAAPPAAIFGAAERDDSGCFESRRASRKAGAKPLIPEHQRFLNFSRSRTRAALDCDVGDAGSEQQSPFRCEIASRDRLVVSFNG